jgi:hypothetical protein
MSGRESRFFACIGITQCNARVPDTTFFLRRRNVDA